MDKSDITWLVFEPILRYRAEKLPEIVREQGFNCEVFESIPDLKDPRLKAREQDCTVLYGSLEFVRTLQNRDGKWMPGNLGNNSNVTPTEYMATLPLDWFLNRHALFTSWRLFKDRGPEWCRLFNGGTEAPRVFVRPNTGFKSFAGQFVRQSDWAYDVEGIDKLSGVMDTTMVMVNAPIELQGEFRFVIADGRVVTGSEYRWDGKLDVRSDFLEDCFEVAKKVAAHPWQVDIAYTCDVAQTADGPKVVELNGFSSAGLYACDINKVVAAVSKAAWREWTGDDV